MTDNELNLLEWLESGWLSTKDKIEISIQIGLKLTNFGLQYKAKEDFGDLWFKVVDEYKHILLNLFAWN